MIKKLYNKIIYNVQTDKLLHFAFGGWIATICPVWWYAVILAMAVGILKELFDCYSNTSKFDIYDVIATVLGGVVTAVFKLIL